MILGYIFLLKLWKIFELFCFKLNRKNFGFFIIVLFKRVNGRCILAEILKIPNSIALQISVCHYIFVIYFLK